MNQSNASTQNVTQLPLPFEGYPGHDKGNNNGWSCLLAESVAFKKDVTFGIRIQVPNKETVPSWIKKLIAGGQCKTIYVENLNLPAVEVDMIMQLCNQNAVSLVNVSVTNNQVNDNVVVGPW